MRRAILLAGALGIAAHAHAQQPTAAPQPASNPAAAHVHMDAQAPPPATAPQGPPAPGGGPGAGPGAQRGGQPQTPPIEVPWNDAIPAGTPEHAARALKESPRHGEWVDIKMTDGTALKSWVVYPERPNKAGVVLVIHDIRGMARHPARGRRSARAGRIHRHRAGLPFRQGTERRRHRLARHWRGQAIRTLTPDDVVARLERRDGVREGAAGVEREDRRDRLLLGRRAQFRLRGGAAGAECRCRLLRRRAGCRAEATRHGRDPTRQHQGAGPRPLCRQRRAHRRDDSGHRSGDEEELARATRSTRTRARATGSWGSRPVPVARTSKRPSSPGRSWFSSSRKICSSSSGGERNGPRPVRSPALSPIDPVRGIERSPTTARTNPFRGAWS